MNKISVIGLDLAKNLCQLHGVDADGEVVLRKQLRRAQLLRFFAKLPPCLIGIEACGGAHYWSRELTRLGHSVRIIAPAFVKPYLKSNKNDRNDAEAICEAVQRPSMRFVCPKTPEQQFAEWHANDPVSQRLITIPGIGLLTATALAATLGDGGDFRNGRQLAAYLGLVPRQASSGGKQRLLGISKRGDTYLRSLIIHGARAVISHIRRRLQAGRPGAHPWVEQLLHRCHVNEAAVALANKMARTAWVLASKNETYRQAPVV
jgi:transposase